MAFLDTNAHNAWIYSIIHDIWTGNTSRMSADLVKVMIMVTADLAEDAVCSFDCLWVNKTILQKQINILMEDRQGFETVPNCKYHVWTPLRAGTFGKVHFAAV